MKKIKPVIFLLIFCVMSNVSLAARKIQSGTVDIHVNVINSTCQSSLSGNNLNLNCNRITKSILPEKIKNGENFENINLIKMEYINASHSRGVISVSYK